jgi:hypothetical protein
MSGGGEDLVGGAVGVLVGSSVGLPTVGKMSFMG